MPAFAEAGGMTGCEEWRSGYRIYQHPQFGCFQQAAAVAVKILIAFLRADNIESIAIENVNIIADCVP